MYFPAPNPRKTGPHRSRKKIEIAENRAELGFPYGFLAGFLPSIL
jgi:hypothetical protein